MPAALPLSGFGVPAISEGFAAAALGWPPSRTAASASIGMSPSQRPAPRDGAGGFVEEGVAVLAGEGHGPLLLDHRLELVQQAALAVHVEHRGLAPDAEMPVIASKSESTS